MFSWYTIDIYVLLFVLVTLFFQEKENIRQCPQMDNFFFDLTISEISLSLYEIKPIEEEDFLVPIDQVIYMSIFIIQWIIKRRKVMMMAIVLLHHNMME